MKRKLASLQEQLATIDEIECRGALDVDELRARLALQQQIHAIEEELGWPKEGQAEEAVQ